MVNCLIYWLSPEEIRKNTILCASEEQAETKKGTERTFDVMGVAYERWVTRGANHYVEVASALAKFYSQLRWAMSLQQPDGELPSDIEKQIAEEAYHYLVHVQSLDSGAKRNGVKRSGFAHPFRARQAELGEAS